MVVATFLACATVLPAGASSTGTKVSIRSTAAYGPVLVVGSSPHNDLNGFPLYIFSGDADGRLGCSTKRATGYDLGPSDHVVLTCTGPERDMLRSIQSDDWPALTTVAAPVAGKGVQQSLLGTVDRKGIGEQVTYAGHPLYLFDPWSAPFDPQGEFYLESVHPLAPWHGDWTLIASSGLPAPGRVTVRAGVLPTGKKVVAVAMDPNVKPVAVSVYELSSDQPGRSSCYQSCAIEWIPVLTSSAARPGPGVAASALGTLRRRDGTLQVTYDHRPLYLYSKERVFFDGLGLKSDGSAGNGNGRKGPNGGTFSLIHLP